MKIRTVLVEDDRDSLEFLQALCEKEEDIEVVECFRRGDDFMNGIKSDKFDLCLLDIEMPGLTGIECAERLRDKVVVFVSGKDVPAHEVFDLDVEGFVKKPINVHKFKAAIERVREKLRNLHGVEYAFFKTSNGMYKVNFDDLISITKLEAETEKEKEKLDSRDKEALLKDGTKLKLKGYSIDEIVGILPAKDFIQVFRSTVINKSAITVAPLSDGEIIIKLPDPKNPLGKKEYSFQLGNTFREDFQKKMGLK